MKRAVVRIGDLNDRIRIERYALGVWSIVAVTSACVAPGPLPRFAPATDPAVAAAQQGNAYAITVRYRQDVTRGMRVRWGNQILVLQFVDDLDGDRRWSRLSCETWQGFAARHDALLGAVIANGAAITFSRSSTAATYDSATDTVASPIVPTTVAGVATQDATSLEKFEAGTLVDTATISLLFVPTIYGQLPMPGATCAWAGENASVVTVDPIAPDGVPIGARIVVTR